MVDNRRETAIKEIIDLDVPGISSVTHHIYSNKVTYEDVKDELEKSKKQLNDTKGVIDRMPNKEPYLRDLRALDMYRGLNRELYMFKNAQCVTNAWRKYRELLSLLSAFIPEKVNAFLNAELPGAAICALNHWCFDEKRGLKWWGSSLYAPNTTALGDTFSLYGKNRDRWLMDNITPGDMTDVEQVIAIGEKAKTKNVNLYSHDAGMDVESDPMNQEKTNFMLHLGCFLCGLICLQEGGVLIAKQYTLFERENLTLVSMYAKVFDKFMIIKTQSSRPYNSEMYLVGVGYYPEKAERLIRKLIRAMKRGGVNEKTRVNGDVVRAAVSLADKQGRALKFSFTAREYVRSKEKKDHELMMQTKWLEDQQVGFLPTEKWIPSNVTPPTDRERFYALMDTR